MKRYVVQFFFVVSLIAHNTHTQECITWTSDPLCMSTSFNAWKPEATCLIQESLHQLQIISNESALRRTTQGYEKKQYLFMVYMAADNDLHPFSWENIRQLARGANEHVHILVQINEPGNNKMTQRYLIEKNKAILLNKENNKKLNSGDPNTLVDFCCWSIENFPAEEQVLVLWDHATGIIDPVPGKAINPSELFVFNPASMMLELDRTHGYLDLIASRGICFDETFKSYLTNEKLVFALEEIQKTALKGKKFAIIGMDACLEGMLEVANLFKKYAHIQVSSQEVEYGAGWRYDRVLRIFESGPATKEEFARHIVRVYQETYGRITNDYTLSAVNLDELDLLEHNVDTVSRILLQFLNAQRGNSVRNAIRQCLQGIAFDEPTYIDLSTFYFKLMQAINNFSYSENLDNLRYDLLKKLEEGRVIINKIVIANTAGKNLKHAHGISVYFAKHRVHSSYARSPFAQANEWGNLIGRCVLQ